ncbi:MAG: hypothetical protein IPJ65_04430 [Archangiaceae bacterium]|nr:hypothetical protein [Archangiaceae bacterium]
MIRPALIGVASSTLLLLCACGELKELLPAESDAGQTRVPGSYLDARVSAGHRAHLALSGEKQLSCHDCHLIADAGFTGRAVVPCATCHEKQQQHHHPFDGGVPMGCTSCHVFRSLGEAALIDKWGCRRCHVEQLDGGSAIGPVVGHANPEHLPPHVTVHTEKCESCHRPHGTPFTLAADCGSCHEVTVSHGKGEKALVADTCMVCHPHHSPAKVALGMCVGCHVGGPVPAKAQVKPGALFAKGHEGCSTCHRPHQFVAQQAKACVTCHANQPVLAAEKHGPCITCHRPHEDRASARTCESCHVKVHLQHPVDAQGRSCLGCHPVHAAEHGQSISASATVPVYASSLAVPCITCHQKAPFTVGVVHAAGLECLSCHQGPHQGKPKREGLCQGCHAEQHQLTKLNKGHQVCDKCHAALPHGPPAAPLECLSCHKDKVPPQRGHVEQLQCKSCHQSHSAKVLTKCTDCHDKPEKRLPGLHRIAKHQQCASCHSAHAAPKGLEPQTCRSCHTQLPVKTHPTPPQQCVSCHLFTEVKP